MSPMRAIPAPTAATGTALNGAKPVEGDADPLGAALADPEAAGVVIPPSAADAELSALPSLLFSEVYSAARLLASGPEAVAAISLKVARAPVARLLAWDRAAVGFEVSRWLAS